MNYYLPVCNAIKMANKIYVGFKISDQKPEIFRCTYTPSRVTHGNVYLFTTGPFKTLRKANTYKTMMVSY